MKNQEKIIELGVDGGSVTIFKFYDKNGNDWYYHHTQEMCYEDLGLSGIDKKSKDFSMSFPEAMIKMIKEYNNVMSFYPVFCNLNFQPVIVEFLKAYRNDIAMNKERWFELLEIDESTLDENILEKYDNQN